ncbi:hypothetical protein JOM56_011893 [Amanita muscaria]
MTLLLAFIQLSFIHLLRLSVPSFLLLILSMTLPHRDIPLFRFFRRHLVVNQTTSLVWFGLQDNGSRGNDSDSSTDRDTWLIADSVLSTDSETATCDTPVVVNVDSDQGDSNYLSILSVTRLVFVKPVGDLTGKVPHINLGSSVIDTPSPES